jgi:uncharacterized membrane protein YeaQ/YmgE (transglycosylase-associated protein family)
MAGVCSAWYRKSQKELWGMVNFMVWVMAGAALGWGASRMVRGDTASGLLLNVLAGVVGAYLAGLIITPLFALTALQGGFSALALGIAVLGAAGLLLVVNTPRRARE